MTERTHDNSRYGKIAHDLAVAVRSGRLGEGERFSCRGLSQRYKVSAETVRRAVAMLEEQGIVKLEVGSGVTVLSRNQAMEYLRHTEVRLKALQIREELQVLIEERSRLEQSISRLWLDLLDCVVEESRTTRITLEGDDGTV